MFTQTDKTMSYCVARNCRHTGLKSLTGLCRTHFNEYVETAARKPAVWGESKNICECYLCGQKVGFYLGLHDPHNDPEGIFCAASGHEIAHLRAS